MPLPSSVSVFNWLRESYRFVRQLLSTKVYFTLTALLDTDKTTVGYSIRIKAMQVNQAFYLPIAIE